MIQSRCVLFELCRSVFKVKGVRIEVNFFFAR